MNLSYDEVFVNVYQPNIFLLGSILGNMFVGPVDTLCVDQTCSRMASTISCAVQGKSFA